MRAAPLVPLAIFFIIFAMVFAAGLIFVLWVLPIWLGIRTARQKNYTPLWMLFGIHPLGGWIAFIVLSSLPPRHQCTNCGGFVPNYFRLCPYCHREMTPPTPMPPRPI